MMADLVRSQTLHDGPKNCVMEFTNISDGVGESAVLKVDVSALSGAPASVAIERVQYTTAGLGVDILWDATTPVLAFHCPANETGEQDFRRMGALTNPKTSGWTGDLKFTTLDHASGDRYTIVLHMKKKY
jgi:hypothetical protein